MNPTRERQSCEEQQERLSGFRQCFRRLAPWWGSVLPGVFWLASLWNDEVYLPLCCEFSFHSSWSAHTTITFAAPISLTGFPVCLHKRDYSQWNSFWNSSLLQRGQRATLTSLINYLDFSLHELRLPVLPVACPSLSSRNLKNKNQLNWLIEGLVLVIVWGLLSKSSKCLPNQSDCKIVLT